MPDRAPRPPTYREMMDALGDAHLKLRNILVSNRLSPDARDLLQIVFDEIDRLVAKDDGRSR